MRERRRRAMRFGSGGMGRNCVDDRALRVIEMSEWKLMLWTLLVKPVNRMARFTSLNALAVRHLFKVCVAGTCHDHYWDETSFAMRRAIRAYVQDGDRVLDLGTGHLGLLAVYCAKIRDVKLQAVDITPEFVQNAECVARASGAVAIDFRRSDWFSNVSGTFDVIFSNVPYVPTGAGLQRKPREAFREVWDGGEDGCMHARTILHQVCPFLSDGGRLLLGTNGLYVDRSTMNDLISQVGGLRLEEVLGSRWLPSKIYVVSRP
jgi:hypothetical protein